MGDFAPSSYNTTYYYGIGGPEGAQLAYYEVDSTNMTITAFPESAAHVQASATAIFLKDPFYKDQINVTFP
jgi:hypothetical protein